MATRKLYKEISSKVDAYHRSVARCSNEWAERHKEVLKELESFLPSGSGFDSGTQIDIENSSGEKLVFHTSYHHMNETGMYDGWTEHRITVKPSLQFDFTLSITGRNKNLIKDDMYQDFDFLLRKTVIYDENGRVTNLKVEV